MGKVVKKVLKVAAIAAISVFAPVVAAPILGSVGITGALATTLGSAAIGAGVGKLIPGISSKAGLLAGGLGGLSSSGALGGTAASSTAAGVPTLTPNVPYQFGGLLSGQTAGLADGAASSLGGALGAAGAKTGGGFLGLGSGGLGAALSGTLNTAGNVLRMGLNSNIAPQLLAAGLVSTPGKAITKAQQAELARAQQENAALTQLRKDWATQIYGDGAYFDPEFMGRQAAENAMTRGAVQATEATRGLTGERLAAERRRYKLGTARTAGTAYQQGYGTGVESRIKTRIAGVNALPTEYPTTASESASALNNALAGLEARRAQETGLANLFGSVLGAGGGTAGSGGITTARYTAERLTPSAEGAFRDYYAGPDPTIF